MLSSEASQITQHVPLILPTQNTRLVSSWVPNNNERKVEAYYLLWSHQNEVMNRSAYSTSPASDPEKARFVLVPQ